ncbi:MAG: hypothetical protein JWO64_508 [Hyphomicrobiales bacterium]|nr:hypothetical protein [Hyphomicrobiales bacterium]
MVVNPRKTQHFDEPESGRGILFAALSLIPLAALTGAALDCGRCFLMTQRLDAVAQSALASALAQGRELRDGRYNVTVEDMELKGRSRADLVFNAQKPNLRDLRTTYTLKRTGAVNVFDARVAFVASVNTVFLRFAGLAELEIEGAARTTWVARDALIDERFEEQQADVLAAERKTLSPPSGWWSSARTKINGAPVMQLAAAQTYAGPPPPENVKIAVELDTADGNVFISKKFSAEPGSHQLRYWYRDRAEDRQVAPAWLCATREEDIAWMGSRDGSPAADTNRMGVYLSGDAGSAIPAAEALNATTRVDSCYSSGLRWIERVVKIDILARGNYWLTFRGEGRSDRTGAAVANILFCREPCMDEGALPPPISNYPWSAGELLFEENFAGPVREPSPAWPMQPPGWTVWPGRSVKHTAGQGGAPGYVELDTPVGDGFQNQRMGRPFLLVPGFYQLRYAYSVGPNSPHREVACNYFGLAAALQGVARVPGASTHRINVIIDPDQPYLHPEIASGNEALTLNWYSAERVLERDASGQKRQMLPDVANAVDFCVGAPSNMLANREVNFRIDKPGYYWITFAAEGPADGAGGRIGAVQLFARGTRFSGEGIPRIIRYTERSDVTTPALGSLQIQPPSSSGQRALYRVQVQ